uniref:CX domain-containing protein n=1 Tax=Plectus sambesii TaxID=2011161 RepID=A0A914VVZ2_9BILA
MRYWIVGIVCACFIGSTTSINAAKVIHPYPSLSNKRTLEVFLALAGNGGEQDEEMMTFGSIQLGMRPFKDAQCSVKIDMKRYAEREDLRERKEIDSKTVTVYLKCLNDEVCCNEHLCCPTTDRDGVRLQHAQTYTKASALSLFFWMVFLCALPAILILIAFLLFYHFYMKPRELKREEAKSQIELRQLNSRP